MEETMKKKWDRSTMRIVSAKHVSWREVLDVKFENGDSFLVPTEVVVQATQTSPGANGSAMVLPNWSKMRIGETGDMLEVPAGRSLIEIPWDRIRCICDPEFRAM